MQAKASLLMLVELVSVSTVCDAITFLKITQNREKYHI